MVKGVIKSTSISDKDVMEFNNETVKNILGNDRKLNSLYQKGKLPYGIVASEYPDRGSNNRAMHCLGFKSGGMKPISDLFKYLMKLMDCGIPRAMTIGTSHGDILVNVMLEKHLVQIIVKTDEEYLYVNDCKIWESWGPAVFSNDSFYFIIKTNRKFIKMLEEAIDWANDNSPVILDRISYILNNPGGKIGQASEYYVGFTEMRAVNQITGYYDGRSDKIGEYALVILDMN